MTRPDRVAPGTTAIAAQSPQNEDAEDHLDAVSFQQVPSNDAFSLVIGISVV